MNERTYLPAGVGDLATGLADCSVLSARSKGVGPRQQAFRRASHGLAIGHEVSTRRTSHQNSVEEQLTVDGDNLTHGDGFDTRFRVHAGEEGEGKEVKVEG